MKTNSPLFDGIRVKPDQDRRLRTDLPSCQWPKCDAPATHRAPKGRLTAPRILAVLPRPRARIQQLIQFLRRHERGRGREIPEGCAHRPSPDLENGFGRRQSCRQARRKEFRGAERPADDPFSLFGEAGDRTGGHAQTTPEERKIFNAQRRALEVLGLEVDAKRADIKAKFKMLVKRHHPDANGGDRGSEAQLREIIQAYNYLKSAGFC